MIWLGIAAWAGVVAVGIFLALDLLDLREWLHAQPSYGDVRIYFTDATSADNFEIVTFPNATLTIDDESAPGSWARELAFAAALQRPHDSGVKHFTHDGTEAAGVVHFGSGNSAKDAHDHG